jgi:hypothetical protein
MESILRFIIGGLVVSAFAVVGDIFRPRTFSGIFGAAPTVALATLGLTFASEGAQKVATEGRSMLLGALALMVYSLFTRYLLLRRGWTSPLAAFLAYVVWLAVALGLWFILLR